MAELTYSKNGDYLIPDLKMDEQPEGFIGKYGMLRETFLKEHRRGTYSDLLLSCRLKAHLLEIDRTGMEMERRIMKELAEQRGITEQLKRADQMRWVQEMENIRDSAQETVMHDLIYV